MTLDETAGCADGVDKDQVDALEAELERQRVEFEAYVERMQAATEAPVVPEVGQSVVETPTVPSWQQTPAEGPARGVLDREPLTYPRRADDAAQEIDDDRRRVASATPSGDPEARVALRVAAALLSAVVPGAGLFLRRRFFDGLFVFFGCLVLFSIPVGVEMADPGNSIVGALGFFCWTGAVLLYVFGIAASAWPGAREGRKGPPVAPQPETDAAAAAQAEGAIGSGAVEEVPEPPAGENEVAAPVFESMDTETLRVAGDSPTVEQAGHVTDSLFWRIVVIFGGMALGYAATGGIVVLLSTLNPSLWDSAAFIVFVLIFILLVGPVGGVWLLHLVLRRVFGLRVRLKLLRPKEERADPLDAAAGAAERAAIDAACSGCLLAMVTPAVLLALLAVALAS